MWSLISFLVTDTGFIGNICIQAPSIADYVQKLPKTQEKHTAERPFSQPKCQDTETHAAAYTAFSKRIHVKL